MIENGHTGKTDVSPELYGRKIHITAIGEHCPVCSGHIGISGGRTIDGVFRSGWDFTNHQTCRNLGIGAVISMRKGTCEQVATELSQG